MGQVDCLGCMQVFALGTRGCCAAGNYRSFSLGKLLLSRCSTADNTITFLFCLLRASHVQGQLKRRVNEAQGSPSPSRLDWKIVVCVHRKRGFKRVKRCRSLPREVKELPTAVEKSIAHVLEMGTSQNHVSVRQHNAGREALQHPCHPYWGKKKILKKTEDTRYRELEDKVLRNRGKIQTQLQRTSLKNLVCFLRLEVLLCMGAKAYHINKTDFGNKQDQSVQFYLFFFLPDVGLGILTHGVDDNTEK